MILGRVKLEELKSAIDKLSDEDRAKLLGNYAEKEAEPIEPVDKEAEEPKEEPSEESKEEAEKEAVDGEEEVPPVDGENVEEPVEKLAEPLEEPADIQEEKSKMDNIMQAFEALNKKFDALLEERKAESAPFGLSEKSQEYSGEVRSEAVPSKDLFKKYFRQ